MSTQNKDDKPQPELQLRAKAEAKLASVAQANESRGLLHHDEILHELHVHQIELEMQNEELRRAQAALETSRAHYVELYDFAPVGYLTLNTEGLIAEINLTGARLLGAERKQLKDRRFAQFIADGYKDTWYRQCLETRRHGRKLIVELPLCREDGICFFANLDCLHLATDDASPLLRIVLTDITERKQAEEALHIAAVAFETQEGIILATASKVIIRVNQAFTRLTGYTAEEAVGKTPSFLRSGLHGGDFYEGLWATVDRDGFWQGEIWDKRKNGEIFPVWQTITAITDTDGTVTHYIGALTDITVQKRAEKVLLDAHQRLENQVATTAGELEKIKEETLEINAALNVMLKHRELDKTEAQTMLSDEAEATVQPLLKMLKGASEGNTQTLRLVNILEANLQHLVQCYGRGANLAAVYHKLTPIETQVASMVRQGQPTKVIAAALHISPKTVSGHRKHIRKKLGLDNTTTNLCSYLQSTVE